MSGGYTQNGPVRQLLILNLKFFKHNFVQEKHIKLAANIFSSLLKKELEHNSCFHRIICIQVSSRKSNFLFKIKKCIFCFSVYASDGDFLKMPLNSHGIPKNLTDLSMLPDATNVALCPNLTPVAIAVWSLNEISSCHCLHRYTLYK